MRNRGPILMLLCVLTSLLVPGIASASTAAGAETRVGAFDFHEQVRTGVERSPTLELHQGCAFAYDRLANLASRKSHGPSKPHGGLDGESGSKSGPRPNGDKLCFAAATLVLLTQGAVAIEHVQLGDRVEETGLEFSSSAEECGERQWYAITAELETSDGHLQELRLLRSAEWLESGELAPGVWISLRTAGLEFDSFARVTGVEPGVAQTGPGALVLATMTREVDGCLSIRLRDQPEPLLVTAKHPLWRAAAGFVPAGRLAAGDLLATQHGVVEIEDIAPVAGPVRVVNLEVDRASSYFVGAALVLAHNDCPDGDTAAGGGARTPITSGAGRAGKTGTPNSIYEQVDDAGRVRSRTFYDESGRPFSRQDFDHPHGGVQPHEHNRLFNANGRPITPETVRPLPPGYTNTLSGSGS